MCLMESWGWQGRAVAYPVDDLGGDGREVVLAILLDLGLDLHGISG